MPDDQPTQPTQPQDPDAEPIEIPVPTRDRVLRDLMKAAPKAAGGRDDPSSESAKPRENG